MSALRQLAGQGQPQAKSRWAGVGRSGQVGWRERGRLFVVKAAEEEMPKASDAENTDKHGAGLAGLVSFRKVGRKGDQGGRVRVARREAVACSDEARDSEPLGI